MKLHSSLMLTSAMIGALVAGDATAAENLEQVTFVVPNPSAILYMPVAVALGEGYFEDEGLDVEVEDVNGSGAVLQARVFARHSHRGHLGHHRWRNDVRREGRYAVSCCA